MSTVIPFTTARELDAPRALVYEANVSPEHLEHWIGPDGFRTIHNAIDLRPGGIHHYGMESPSGAQMWGKREFREIRPQQQLTFLQSFSNPEGGLERHPMAPTWPLQMWSVVTFADNGAGRTRMSVSWTPHESDEAGLATFEAARPGLEEAFTGMWRQLEAYLARLQNN